MMTHHKLAGWLAPLTVSAFDLELGQTGQYANNPGNSWGFCYTELAVSSLAVS